MAVRTAIAAGLVVALAGEGLAQAPMPRPHPDRVAEEVDPVEAALAELDPADRALFETIGATDLLLGSAYRRFRDGDIGSANRIARAMPGEAGALLIAWLTATSGYPQASSAEIAEAMAVLPDWPGQVLMQIRFEQALRDEEPGPEEAVAALAGASLQLEASVLLLGRSYAALGREAERVALIRDYWREADFSEEMEAAILDEFADTLRPSDHAWRMNRLHYDGENDAALRVADLIGPDMQALAEAWAAVNGGSGNAAALIDAVPTALRSEPGYQFVRFRQAMRAGAYSEAARLVAEAPDDPSLLIDPEAWSVQRRDLARLLIDRGEYETAYSVAAGHSAVDRGELVEIEFVAGWIALSFLDDPDRALPHFERLAESSSLPLSQSRAHYWIGRSHGTQGSPELAAESYAEAATYHTTYYGQLALLQLGEEQIPLAEAPTIDAAVRERFAANEMVQAVGWLYAFDRPGDAALIARALGNSLESPAEIALLAAFVETRGDHQLALQVGKLAANRGLAVDRTAFSTAVMPPGSLEEDADLALVLAVARQESAFDITAESSAGALGLLQILPSTAREMAGRIGLPFSEIRLRTDPQYNAAIGAAYLRTLLERYGGNHALALAAFNAGLSRADRWIDAYGDPRSTSVDTVDWIERIPFDETRNYVQRVLENDQVYRAILGGLPISLGPDLNL